MRTCPQSLCGQVLNYYACIIRYTQEVFIMTDTKKRREHIIRVRVNEAEYSRFHDYAEKLGYRSISEFVRSLVNSSTTDEDLLSDNMRTPKTNYFGIK